MASRVAAQLRVVQARWLVRLGPRRMSNLRGRGRTIEEVAEIAAAPAEQVVECYRIIDEHARSKPKPPYRRDAVLSPRVEELSRLWRGGMPVKQLALHFRVSRARIGMFISMYRHTVDVGAFPLRIGTKSQIKRRIKGWARPDADVAGEHREIVEARRSGMSVKEAALRFGLSSVTISRICRRAAPLDSDDVASMEAFEQANGERLEKGIRLWSLGAHTHEIAEHYKTTYKNIARMIADARRITRGLWFGPRA